MNYDDIIQLSRPISNKYAPMSIEDRAAQFAPFAALTGHNASLGETARITEKRIELDEAEKEIINRNLLEIYINRETIKHISITHFVEDLKKEGGAYTVSSGVIKKLDTVQRVILLNDGILIDVDNIVNIEW